MSDLARRARLHDLEAQIRTCYAQAARELWRMGCWLLEIQRDELWRDQHEGFEAWLDASRVTGRATAYKAMRIAREFGEEVAVRFGTEKLHAGISYLQATVKEETAGDLMALAVRVRGEDGAYKTVPFADASTEQIRKAASDLGHTRRQAALPKDLRDRLAKVNRDLPKSKRAYKSAKVHVRKDRDGQVLVSLAAVPLEHLEAFVAAVRAGLMG